MPTPASAPRKQRLLLALRILATLLLIGVVLVAVPLGKTWEVLRGIALWGVMAALVAELAQRTLSIVRWHLLLPPAGVRIPLTRTLRLGFVALFYNNFAPSTVGGDVAKSYLVIRGGASSSAAVVASVLVDRAVIGWGSLVAFGLLISAFLDTPEYQTAILVLLGGGLVAALVTLWLARRKCGTPDQPRGMFQTLLRKAADKLTEVSAALLRYRKHRIRLALSFAVSCLGIVAMGVALQYWCASLGHTLPLARMIAVAVILKIVGIVPVSISNIGWSEGATVVLLQWAGMSQSEALAVGVLQRAAGTLISLTGAFMQFGGKPAVAVEAVSETEEAAR